MAISSRARGLYWIILKIINEKYLAVKVLRISYAMVLWREPS